MVKVRKDLTGQRFGRIVVIKQAEDRVYDNGRHIPQWLCQCDCGSDVFITLGSSLKNGRTQSCGCLQKERSSESMTKMLTKYNKYDLSGEHGIGYTENGEAFWFDKEDYDLIKDYYWSYNENGYVSTVVRITSGKYKQFLLHRIVMNAPKNKRVDHIIHPKGKEHKKDNRKCNLRLATASQNGMNSCLSKNNTSGVTGVSWHKGIQKWTAYIGYNKKLIRLGSFDSFEDAVKARKEAEEKYFGEWSYNNSQTLVEEEEGA